MNHQLKTVQPFFDDVVSGVKTAELRRDDRTFQVGDTLTLREYELLECVCGCGVDNSSYSGRTVTVEVTHVLRNFVGLKPGWVMLSFKVVGQ